MTTPHDTLPWPIPGQVPAADGFAAFVVARDDVEAADALQAVALTGGRTLARVAWAAAAEAIAAAGPRPVVWLEAIGMAEAELVAALPTIVAGAETESLGVVVALEETQIDLIGAVVLGERTQLLCRPSMAERVAALAMVAEDAGRVTLHDQLAEGEAARLARLNAEVARIAGVLARLTRRDGFEIDPMGARIADRRQTFDAGPVSDHEAIDPQEIRRTIRARRMRDQQFGAGLFEDPAWDMMLDLFAAHLEHAQVSVSSLCIAAAVAPTTALRWIGKLTDAGLFERRPDPFDRRRAFMVLSRRAVEGMHAHCAALRRAGLALA